MRFAARLYLCKAHAKNDDRHIRLDIYKRQNQNEAEETPRFALQSSENERSEITRERKTKK